MRYLLLLGSLFLVNEAPQRVQLNDWNSAVARSFRDNFIVPNIIQSPPINRVEINYASGVSVNLGNVLTPRSVRFPPVVTWPVRQPQQNLQFTIQNGQILQTTNLQNLPNLQFLQNQPNTPNIQLQNVPNTVNLQNIRNILNNPNNNQNLQNNQNMQILRNILNGRNLQNIPIIPLQNAQNIPNAQLQNLQNIPNVQMLNLQNIPNALLQNLQNLPNNIQNLQNLQNVQILPTLRVLRNTKNKQIQSSPSLQNIQIQNIPNSQNIPYHTLVMIDPDAGEVSEVKHWLVVNIPGNDVSRGQEIAEYIGSAAPRGTGFHRYIFLVYEQPNGPMQFDEPSSDDDDFSYRPFFRVQQFANRYNLGQPVAGNFFMAAWDDTVPALRARLGLD